VHFPTFRTNSRRDRYNSRRDSAKSYPLAIATVNFGCDENLGYIIRAAACFGCYEIHVVGNIPERNFLSSVSGSLIDYVNLISHSTPHALLEHARSSDMLLVSAELRDHAVELDNYEFDFNRKTCIVLGNENWGVPEEIIHNSDVVMIPMPGVGACLNTAQTGNIILYEYNRQFTNHVRNREYLCAE